MQRPLGSALDLASIARFVAVAEAGSFARAAALLGVPKSTLSRAVTRLETSLGVRLLERTTRSVRTTDEGKALAARARSALEALEEAADTIADSPAKARGTLRISAPPDLGDLLSDMVARFVERYPEVQVEFELSTRYVDLVADDFDAAIRAGTLRDSSLVARKLVDLRIGLYASPGYLAKHGHPKKVADLERHAFVRFSGFPREGLRLSSPQGTQRVSVTGNIGASDLAFVRSCVKRGAGIGILPCLVGAEDVAAGHLVRVLPAFETGRTSLHLVYPSARNAPGRLAAFREFAQAYFAELDPTLTHRRSSR